MVRLRLLLAIPLIALFLAGCGGCGRDAAETPRTVTAPEFGAWLDEIVFREEADASKIVEMMKAGQVDAYASGINDPEILRKIQESPSLDYLTSYGTSYELTFNPSGPVFSGTGELNPFAVEAVREAMNWLIDRKHIADEIFGGLAVPRYLPISTAFTDYARLADAARLLEIRYSPDPEKARSVIAREMERLGARRIEGKWNYRGKPVRVILLIRSDDSRRELGDYIGSLLENTGFTVERQYKTPTEASPIWIGSNPSEGLWHIYTGGWVSLAVKRDERDVFDYYYTPRGRAEPLWQAFKPSKRFNEIAERLGRGDYETLDERSRLMEEALELAMANSSRLFVVDAINLWPKNRNLAVSADLAGGITGSFLYPYTIRMTDRSGGRANFAAPSILTEPWNPVAGTNWIFDHAASRPTQDLPAVVDPHTGLDLPQRVVSAEVRVKRGLPVGKTRDWVTLEFADSIPVPADAWIEWDAGAELFRTVREKHPQGLTARTRTIVRYEDDLFEKHWHDGSRVMLADFILNLIVGLDRADRKSPLFDEATLPRMEAFRKQFRGVRIASQNPFTVEVYSDDIASDAEELAGGAARFFYMTDPHTSAPWHTVALGILAEQGRELAFSAAKADKMKVEWMNYVDGPSLTVLEKHLATALRDGFIPYAPTMGKYVTAEQAKVRYNLLKSWKEAQGHFWVGSGPYQLHSVHSVEKFVVVRKSPHFKDNSNRWTSFSAPRIPEIEVAGPKEVEIGKAAEFAANVTFRGADYPPDEILFVRYLLFDARGSLIAKGDAPLTGSRGTIALTPEISTALAAGSNRLEIIVASRTVAIPAFKTHFFITR